MDVNTRSLRLEERPREARWALPGKWPERPPRRLELEGLSLESSDLIFGRISPVAGASMELVGAHPPSLPTIVLEHRPKLRSEIESSSMLSLAK